MTKGRFAVVTRLTANPGRRADLAGHLLRAAHLLESDPNCFQYLVATSTEPDLVYVLETWADEDAHTASLQRADVRELIDEAAPTIAGLADQVRLIVHGGMG